MMLIFEWILPIVGISMIFTMTYMIYRMEKRQQENLSKWLEEKS